MDEAYSASSSYGQFIVVLLIFAGVLAVTYFVTKWVAGYQRGRSTGANIQLLESAPLASGKHIQIVRIGNRYVALAVCKDTVTVLTQLNEEELVLPEGQDNFASSFKEILAGIKKADTNDGNK